MSVSGPEYGRQRALPRAAAFWLIAVVLTLSLFAATAPSPLYRVYEAHLRFSAATLTAVFAVYAIAVLITLLIFGTLSDYLGRRPVIAAALVVNIGACALFLMAHDVGLLFAARVLQGIAVGAATGALGAAMIDLQPAGSSLAPVVNSAATSMGLAAGALGTSVLVHYAPAPTHLVWWLLLGGLAVAIIGVLMIPESAARRPGALSSLRPRVSIPPQARKTFVVAVPCLIAVWALGGLYLSLGPSLAAQVLRSPNDLWGGLVIFLLTGIGSASAVAFRRINPPTAMLAGCLFLLAGIAVTLAAIATMTAVTFLAGTAIAGVGFGVAFLGAFRTVAALADPADRAGLVAAIYTVNYLGFSIPALIAGVAVTHYGLRSTALVYCAVIAALVAAAVGSLMLRRRHLSKATGRGSGAIDLPPGPCTVPPTTCRTNPAGNLPGRIARGGRALFPSRVGESPHPQETGLEIICTDREKYYSDAFAA
jgi:MFS family permease